jgi:hypothetical protein
MMVFIFMTELKLQTNQFNIHRRHPRPELYQTTQQVLPLQWGSIIIKYLIIRESIIIKKN